jgi:hypothetical protein
LGLGAAGLNFASIPFCLFAQPRRRGPVAQCTPESQGVSSAGILAFLDAIAQSKHEFHSFMMARHGQIIAEGWWSPYAPEYRHMLYSLSKSFTSTAIGFAVTEGLLKVDAPVVSFFPDDLPPTVSEKLAAMRVKHLLMMSVGHATDTTHTIAKEENWVKTFLSLPVDHNPGSVFLYNSGATYMLSAIVQKVSGSPLTAFLRPRFFDPLDIHGISWETCPRGINTGGWGLSVRTEALAKFARFYLQKGMWNGQQILPHSWIEEATTFKIQQPPTGGANLEKLKQTSDWHQGYCYQFWRCRHNAFRGDGAFGQYAIIMPDQDAVIAITCETSDMQGELNLVWEHLLPAMKDGTLPEDESLQTQLQQRLKSLALPMLAGSCDSQTMLRITGKEFLVADRGAGGCNLRFDFAHNTCKFTLRSASRNYSVDSGMQQWAYGETSMPGTPPKITVGNLLPVKVAGSAGWTDANTLVLTWRYYETPHHDTVTCRFDGDNVEVKFLNSITEKSASHPEMRPVLSGKVTA